MMTYMTTIANNMNIARQLFHSTSVSSKIYIVMSCAYSYTLCFATYKYMTNDMPKYNNKYNNKYNSKLETHKYDIIF